MCPFNVSSLETIRPHCLLIFAYHYARLYIHEEHSDNEVIPVVRIQCLREGTFFSWRGGLGNFNIKSVGPPLCFNKKIPDLPPQGDLIPLKYIFFLQNNCVGQFWYHSCQIILSSRSSYITTISPQRFA